MVADVDRRRLLDRLEAAWRSFRDSYAGLSEAEMARPGVNGEWSVRDVIAHVTAWEEEALAHLPAILEGRRPPRYSVRYGGIDAFNALRMKRDEGLSLPEVLRRQEEVHRRLVDLVRRAPGEHLKGDSRFRRRLRLDTYGHYRKHEEAIRRWRERTAAGPLPTGPGSSRSRLRGKAGKRKGAPGR